MIIPPFVRGSLAQSILILALASPLFGAAPMIRAGSKPLSVDVSSGTMVIDGKSVSIMSTTLTVAPPQSTEKTLTTNAPVNYKPAMDGWLPWKSQTPKKNGAITLSKRADEHGVLMLGLPYRQYPVESIVVKNESGSKTFVAGKDYKLLEDYGQITNLNDALGKPGEDKITVNYVEVDQRLDLIQVSPVGKVSVKPGKSRFVCPTLPEPDAGYAALAGIYVAPWQPADEPLAADLILPIDNAAPVEPVNPEAASKTLAKLQKGEPVSIAYMGDSLTLGAEAGKWWEDDTQHWRGRFQHELHDRFPDSKLTEIAAWQGGKGTEFGIKALKETVLPAKPDLLIIMMGINDADGPSDGSRAKVPAHEYSKHIENIITAAQDAGIEVILMTSMQPYPMKPGGHAQRWPEYVAAQEELAQKYKVGLANTYAEWMNLEHRGIPPYSQLHNWNNHPGSFGHKLFSDVTLRFFPVQ